MTMTTSAEEDTPPKLDVLPPEIIDGILGKLPSKGRYLQPVALTSKAFVKPCQRRLLSSVTLSYLHWEKDLPYPEDLPGSQLLSQLVESPHLAQYITSLSIQLPSVYQGRSTPIVPSKDLWIWHDSKLHLLLDELKAVRALKIVRTSKDTLPVSDDLPPLLKDALVRMAARLEVLELFNLTASFLPLVLSPSTRHLAFRCDYSAPWPGNDTLEETADVIALRSAPLLSLAVMHPRTVQRPLDEQGNVLIGVGGRSPFKPDISFVHSFDLSNLRRLYLATCSKSPQQMDFARILERCGHSLEELRLGPPGEDDYGGSIAPFFAEGSPSLANAPSLRHFEASLEIDGVSHFIGERPPDTTEAISTFKTIANFLASAPPSNVITDVILHLHFEDIYDFSYGHASKPPRQVFMDEAANHFTPQLAKRIGMDVLDQVLSSFPVLRKVTFVVGPIQYPSVTEEVLEQFRGVFADFDLVAQKKLEVTTHRGEYVQIHRPIDNVELWYRAPKVPEPVKTYRPQMIQPIALNA